LFREWGRKRKRGIMVTEFGQQIPVKIAAKKRRHQRRRGFVAAPISAWVRRGRHQTPRPCGAGAAPAGCVQRNIDLSELRQIG
jgi:hypothetical protein